MILETEQTKEIIMIKHVGRHNNERVAILYKTVPGEDHMALVAYSGKLPALIHDEVMKTLESEIGQQAKELADALFRTIMADGRNALTAMHEEGLIKKVPTNQVIVTPRANSHVRLDELNSILKKMEAGEEAIQEMANIDAQRGVRDPAKRSEPREVGEPANSRATPVQVQAPQDGALTDVDIARGYRDQATRMQVEAKAMVAEAARLTKEALKIDPLTNAKKTTKKKTTDRKVKS
jgi:hypothetical protein